MIPTTKYKKFLSELIRRHMIILGPNIARDAALHVKGLTIGESGETVDLRGDPMLISKDLIESYMVFCEPVAQLVTYQLLEQYPDIKAEYNEPITEISLTCSLTERTAAHLA